jgi:hypothetical protein
MAEEKTPERVVAIASQVVALAVTVWAIDHQTGGEIAAAVTRWRGRLQHWWDRRSEIRLYLDAVEAGRATVQEAERHRGR